MSWQSLFRVLLLVTLVLTLYFTTTPVQHALSEDINDKFSHALAFMILACLADFSYPQDRVSPAIIYWLSAYGMLLECIQYFLPYRSFSLLDMLADVAGVLFYFSLHPWICQRPSLRRYRLATRE